jgi:hypothetical protein
MPQGGGPWEIGIHGDPGHKAIRRSNTVTKGMGNRLGKHKNFQLIENSPLWKGKICEQLHQVVASGPPWRRLEESVSIYVELIAFITRFSSNDKPTQYLDDKAKEKALAEEMKKTYGTERGSCEIIIKWIRDIATKMETKLMACKILHKCRKEDVPTGVVTTTTQCANDTMLSWAPYLLNMFLGDSKDAQDLGT